MRVVNFKEFCALPEGVVFSYYEPVSARGLFSRQGILFLGEKPIDYFEINIVAYPKPPDDETLEITDSSMRWGMYDYDQLYAIYEDKDLRAMILFLMEGLCKSRQAKGGNDESS